MTHTILYNICGGKLGRSGWYFIIRNTAGTNLYVSWKLHWVTNLTSNGKSWTLQEKIPNVLLKLKIYSTSRVNMLHLGLFKYCAIGRRGRRAYTKSSLLLTHLIMIVYWWGGARGSMIIWSLWLWFLVWKRRKWLICINIHLCFTFSCSCMVFNIPDNYW